MDSTLSICFVMTMTPLSASLGIAVVVSLFSMDGTGMACMTVNSWKEMPLS